MLRTAIEAARRAGQLIAEHFPASRNVTVKGYRDIVTEVDTAAEAIILQLIRGRFPDHAILSEEAGGSTIDDGYTWVIDPLDGTTNYARRLPISTVSIGVLERGKPVVGVIYDPLRDQLFVAEQGKGATLNDEPISASKIARLEHAVIGLDWGRSDQDREKTLRFLLQIAPRCGTLRALGSAALAQAYVAAGWLDGYFNLVAKPWDTAAGVLIVAEAGGMHTTVEGEPYRVAAHGCLATNGLIHEELLSIIHTPDAARSQIPD
jgi:myo-inositol-1(or 4)-monophosphatase